MTKRSLLACALLLLTVLAAPPLAAQDAADEEPAADDVSAAAAPREVTTAHTLEIDGRGFDYTATVARLPIGEDTDDPDADMFFTAYTLDGAQAATRPVTFLFNGGPGAASIFLHIGGLGPQRLVLEEDGTPPPPPVRLEPNPASWLPFTDLVFIDPVGTGYSRVREEEGDDDGEEEGDRGRRGERPSFADVERDLASLADFIRLWLTRYERWSSPKVVAGESYGGFRAARLAERLPDEVGVSLNAVVLVSPALDFALLRQREPFTILPWATLLPSYAATAAAHDKIVLEPNDGVAVDAAAVERFALDGYLTGLADPASAGDPSSAFVRRVARFIGLAPDLIARHRGRVPMEFFVDALLDEQDLLVGRYDGTLTGPDPDPDLPFFRGGDPSFDFVISAYTPAFLGYLRDELGYESDLEYEVLSEETFRQWSYDAALRGGQGYPDAARQLERAIVTQPALHTMVTHGTADLVTPYFASTWLLRQMDLPDEARARVEQHDYLGGHMFYLRAEVATQFRADAAALYERIARSTN